MAENGQPEQEPKAILESQTIPLTDTLKLEILFSSIRELFSAQGRQATRFVELAEKLQTENQELKRKLYPEVNPGEKEGA